MFELIANWPLNCLLIYVFSWLATAVHELGHAYAIKRNGLEVKEIKMGLITVVRMGKLSLGLIPGGFTRTNHKPLYTDKKQNSKVFVITIAGMAAQVLISILLIPFMSNPFVKAFNFVNMLLMTINLIPITERTSGNKKRGTDGLKALQIIKYSCEGKLIFD